MHVDRCDGCSHTFFHCISRFYKNNESSLEFFRAHGVLPTSVSCPTCNKVCSYRSDKHQWRCTSVFSVPKSKKRRFCNFVVSDYTGTFLSGTNLEPWKVLLFICTFCDHTWNHKTVISNSEISPNTSVDWRSFCSEVTNAWFSDQKPISGVGVEVEIDETLIARRKYERGRVVKQVWLFGGIERVSKERFVVALTGDVGEKRDMATLVPLIQKYIKQGSVVYSDCWGAYKGLEELGYSHYAVNQCGGSGSVSIAKHGLRLLNLSRKVKDWTLPRVHRVGLCQGRVPMC